MREIVLKILVGGAGGVGKTTILHRYLHDSFINDTSMTIGGAVSYPIAST